MKLLLTFLFVLVASIAAAQTPVTPSQSFAWDHTGVDVDYFQLCIDGTAETNCTTVAGGAKVRETPIPALTPGKHTWTINTCNAAGCALSPVQEITMRAIPAPATNLRVK